MSRLVEICKMITKDKCLSRKIKFAERVIRRYKIDDKELKDFLNYTLYENVQKRDRYISNDELIEHNIRLEKIAKGRTKAKEDREIERYIQHEKEIQAFDKWFYYLEEMEERNNKVLSRR